MALYKILVNGHCLTQLLCVLIPISCFAIAGQAPDRIEPSLKAPETISLVNFQVYEPVFTPTGQHNKYGCVHTKLLMDHVFAFSYGSPFVGIKIPSAKLPILTEMANRNLQTSSMRLQ